MVYGAEAPTQKKPWRKFTANDVELLVLCQNYSHLLHLLCFSEVKEEYVDGNSTTLLVSCTRLPNGHASGVKVKITLGGQGVNIRIKVGFN
jgi:hypothetical protein